jgi:muramidase (phage lysozyme)
VSDDTNRGGIALLLAAVAAALWYFYGSSEPNNAGDPVLGSAEEGMEDLLNSAQNNDGTINSNRQAFLTMIGQSEVGAALIGETDSGYNVLVGSTPSNPLTFSDYSTHPDILNQALDSTAAGLYQINYPTYKTLVVQTGLSDFSPSTQDAMAIQLIANKGALADVDAGNFASAVQKCSSVWASLPGNSYGQPTNSLSTLSAWFQQAGGILS